MQEQDKEFKIGQKVCYLGGDDRVELYIREIGYVVESDIIGWSGCVMVKFDDYYQIVLKSCLEVIE